MLRLLGHQPHTVAVTRSSTSQCCSYSVINLTWSGGLVMNSPGWGCGFDTSLCGCYLYLNLTWCGGLVVTSPGWGWGFHASHWWWTGVDLALLRLCNLTMLRLWFTSTCWGLRINPKHICTLQRLERNGPRSLKTSCEVWRKPQCEVWLRPQLRFDKYSRTQITCLKNAVLELISWF